MPQKFANLTPEGKLAKIQQHLNRHHPVNSEWVEWLISHLEINKMPQREQAETTLEAFHELNDSEKIWKLIDKLPEGHIPAPWVDWLISKHFPRPSA